MNTIFATTADLLREIARRMAYAEDPVANAMARIIFDAATDWDDFVVSISHPPVTGGSFIRSLYHGDPKGAARAGDAKFADLIHLARIWMEENS